MRLFFSALALTFALCLSVSADPLQITSRGGYDDIYHTAYFNFAGADFSAAGSILDDESYHPFRLWQYGADSGFDLLADNGSSFSHLFIKTPDGKEYEWETDMGAHSTLAFSVASTKIRHGVNSYYLPFTVEIYQGEIGFAAIGSGTAFVKGSVSADGFEFSSVTYKIGGMPTPEPATMLLLGTGLAGLGGIIKKKRQDKEQSRR